MRLRADFSLVSRDGRLPADDFPLEIELDGVRAEVRRHEGDVLDLVVDVRVDPATLRIEVDSRTRDATMGKSIPLVEVPERAQASVAAGVVTDALAFITRTSLSFSWKGTPTLVPENEEDSRVLKSLGTREVLTRLTGSSPGVWTPWPLVASNVAFLCTRPAAIRLYNDALKTGTNVGRLSALWRIVEAAFGEKEKKLVGLVSRCQAATEMEFTFEELESIRTLRGRASHADSRDGFRQLAQVEHDVTQVVSRLQGLAEALVVRKTDWGSKSLSIEPIAKPMPFVRRDGSIVMFVSPRDGSGASPDH